MRRILRPFAASAKIINNREEEEKCALRRTCGDYDTLCQRKSQSVDCGGGRGRGRRRRQYRRGLFPLLRLFTRVTETRDNSFNRRGGIRYRDKDTRRLLSPSSSPPPPSSRWKKVFESKTRDRKPEVCARCERTPKGFQGRKSVIPIGCR